MELILSFFMIIFYPIYVYGKNYDKKKTKKLFGVLFVTSIFIFYTINLSIAIINKNDSTKINGSCNEIVDQLPFS